MAVIVSKLADRGIGEDVMPAWVPPSKFTISPDGRPWSGPCKGIREYMTSTNIPVMIVLYLSDPDKDPDTDDGLAWYLEEINGYPGGPKGPKWLQEMEGRFDVRDSSRVWPNFDDRMNELVCANFDIREYERWPIICGYDYGSGEKGISALLPFAFDGRAKVYQIDEIYGTFTIQEMYEEAKKRWWWERVRTIYADPSIWAHTQVREGGPSTSVGAIWQNEYEVTMLKGQNFVGSDAAYIDLLNSVLWRKLAAKFQILASCTNTIKEYRLLAWKKQSRTSDREPTRYDIANKKVHAFDAGKYVMLEYWQGTSLANVQPPEGSILWHMQSMQRQRESVRYVMSGSR